LPKIKAIKKEIKHIILSVLLVAVLLPFVVQFIHLLEKHEHSVCNVQNKVHFDIHEIDCSVFHFIIHTNAVNSESEISFLEINFDFEKNYSEIQKNKAVKLNFKSSRAPPFLLV